MPIFGRLADVRLVDDMGNCGLREESWYEVIEAYVHKPLLSGLATYAISEKDIKTQPALVAYLEERDPKSNVLSQLDKAAVASYRQRVPTLERFWTRSHRMSNKDLAWKYISNFVNKSNGYLVDVNRELGTIPPFDSYSDDPVYYEPFIAVAKQLLRYAIPNQYPDSPYRQWGPLENVKPFRMMLLEMIYKNFTAKVATDRMCQNVLATPQTMTQSSRIAIPITPRP
ncbi:hypothetical protein HK102_002287 [Quaeritorhiza haematococci]|nr:hypothetical protein HK102_002287 [Quaeritorhiza haematococci]